MNILEIILKKRNGGELSGEEIKYFVDGYVSEAISDYQISALLMAIWFRGMTDRETTDLTMAMAESGDMIDLSSIPGVKVDKHSTGGVADTTTLITAPLAAACGAKVAKMSGRGLGHTGGTLDKLESIPGFNINLTMDDFIRNVSDCGLSVIGQTKNLVPADKMLYALRDVTGTVDNISLIASSVMSKKLAAGSDAIVLDVKTGSGAFMKSVKDSAALARIMVEIGKRAGRKTVALVTDMNQPLGNAIGNALEVREAVEILQGGHDGDLKTLSCALAAEMVLLAGLAEDRSEAEIKVADALASGRALERFGMMINAQGGDVRVVHDTSLLPKASRRLPVTAANGGIISSIDAEAIGASAQLLGAGRFKKSDIIDPAVGIWMHIRLGDIVEKGDALCTIHANGNNDLSGITERIRKAVRITSAEQKSNTPAGSLSNNALSGDALSGDRKLIYQVIR